MQNVKAFDPVICNQLSTAVGAQAELPWVNLPEPMYKRIYRHLRTEIERGRFQHGDRLPSVRTIVADFQVSHPTVLRALEELSSLGYVKLVQGSGSYVSYQSSFEQPKTPELEAFKPHATNFAPPSRRPYKHSVKNLQESHNKTSILPVGRWQRCVRTTLLENLPMSVSRSGLPSLRSAIASYIRRSRGICADPDQIFVTAGLSSSISFLSALCELREKTVAVEEPGSPKIRRLLASNGAILQPIELDAQGMQIDALNELEGKVKLLHVTPNHNPTGMAMSERRRQSLINWASNVKALILEDDFGAEFALSMNGETPLFTLGQNVIYLGGFWGSLHTLANTSFLILPPGLAEQAAGSNHLKDAEQNFLEQHSLQLMLDDGHLELHLKRQRKLSREKRAAAIAALKQALGARIDIIGTGINNKQLVKFHEDIEERNIVTAALRSGLPLTNTADFYCQNRPANEFLLSFNSLDKAKIFATALHFAGLLK